MSHASPSGMEPSYDADHLVAYDKELDFLTDERFLRAYQRGMQSGHHIARERGSTTDLHIEWRIHVMIWAAGQALTLEGDFVECGVNTGMYSLAICDYFDFNQTGRLFWLFDTFSGIPVDQINARERSLGRLQENEHWFSECYELARRNFAPFSGARLVRGRVPDTLSEVDIQRVAFLSLDMNIAKPEVAALEYFWDKLVPGALVVSDDYAWSNYRVQKEGLDQFADRHGVSFLTLPTGQGLLIRPPHA